MYSEYLLTVIQWLFGVPFKTLLFCFTKQKQLDHLQESEGLGYPSYKRVRSYMGIFSRVGDVQFCKGGSVVLGALYVGVEVSCMLVVWVCAVMVGSDWGHS